MRTIFLIAGYTFYVLEFTELLFAISKSERHYIFLSEYIAKLGKS